MSYARQERKNEWSKIESQAKKDPHYDASSFDMVTQQYLIDFLAMGVIPSCFIFR
jgi:hypothetical protein